MHEPVRQRDGEDERVRQRARTDRSCSQPHIEADAMRLNTMAYEVERLEYGQNPSSFGPMLRQKAKKAQEGEQELFRE